MAFVIADRVKESTTTTGTGTITLAGAVTGFQSFAAIGNANTVSYCIYGVDATGVPTGEWETGIGTYTAAGTTLSRGLIASSTGSLVSFAAGTKHVICTDVAKYTTPLVMAATANRAIQVADQTALSSTAGNARGQGAVDLQIRRTVATQVASGAYSGILSGYRNTASGANAVVHGGLLNNASGSYGTVAGGFINVASGPFSIAGGYGCTASGSSSIAIGHMATANKIGQISHAAGRFAASGDAQRSDFVLRRSTTDATQSELFLDGSSARLTIASDTTWAFEALIVARRTDADDESAGYLITGVIDNNAGVVALVGTITVTVIGEDTVAWDVTAEANDTNNALAIKVTGEAGKTIRWVCSVKSTQVTG